MKAIILAAGKGKRINSEEENIPKHLRKVAGKPLLQYVLDAVNFIGKEDIIIVVGFLKEKIMDAFPGYNFAVQDEILGTGHAVKCAKSKVGDYKGDVLVLLGDTPLLEKSSLEKLTQYHQENKNHCTILSCQAEKHMPLGRIVRDEKDCEKFCAIVEEKDCTPEQKNIREYNTGVMLFDSEKLFEELENLKNNNKSSEYYLTDVPMLFIEKNYKIGVYKSENSNDIHGVNTVEDLQAAEKILAEKS